MRDLLYDTSFGNVFDSDRYQSGNKMSAYPNIDRMNLQVETNAIKRNKRQARDEHRDVKPTAAEKAYVGRPYDPERKQAKFSRYNEKSVFEKNDEPEMISKKPKVVVKSKGRRVGVQGPPRNASVFDETGDLTEVQFKQRGGHVAARYGVMN